jgi:uncharacterized protein (DUF2062 family)
MINKLNAANGTDLVNVTSTFITRQLNTLEMLSFWHPVWEHSLSDVILTTLTSHILARFFHTHALCLL